MYDLDDVNEYFEFKANGAVYRMTFPTVQELEKLQDIAAKVKSLKPEEQSKGNEKIMDYILSFIQPVDKDSLSIQEIVKKMNIKSLNKFNDMVAKEFGIE